MSVFVRGTGEGELWSGEWETRAATAAGARAGEGARASKCACACADKSGIAHRGRPVGECLGELYLSLNASATSGISMFSIEGVKGDSRSAR